MLRIILTIVMMGTGNFGFSGEIGQELKNSHQGVENTARQLSSAIDSLNHILGPISRPVASDTELTASTIQNGLKQLALDPARDPKDSFEALKKRYDQISKEYNELVIERAKNDIKEPQEKSESVERALKKERDILLPQKNKIRNQINEQIKSVMEKLNFTPVQPGSTTYKRNNEMVSARFQDGEIVVSPIKPLPPVD